MLVDTTYDVDTPEGVELHLPVAGLAPRSLAWIVDSIIKSIALMLASAILPFLGNFGVGLMAVLAFVLLWFYNVLFEVLGHGATPGKRHIGLAVVNLNGTPVDWSGSMIRNLIRFVDVLPGCYAFGCVSVLLSDRFQRLGDLAAGTVVIHRPKAKPAIAQQRAARAAPLALPVSAEEQQAIIDFADRSATLNPERSEELAAMLEPIVGTVDSRTLCAYANWLAGRDQNR